MPVSLSLYAGISLLRVKMKGKRIKKELNNPQMRDVRFSSDENRYVFVSDYNKTPCSNL